MTTCLITGCRLVIPAEGKSLWGDLHEVNAGYSREVCYVFNGVLNSGEANWDYHLDNTKIEKHVIVHGDYFERRGVVCFTNFEPNQLAREYIK